MFSLILLRNDASSVTCLASNAYPTPQSLSPSILLRLRQMDTYNSQYLLNSARKHTGSECASASASHVIRMPSTDTHHLDTSSSKPAHIPPKHLNSQPLPCDIEPVPPAQRHG